MSAPVGKSIDIAKEFGLAPGLLSRSRAEVILNECLTFRCEAVRVIERSPDFMGKFFIPEDLVFELTISQDAMHQINDAMASQADSRDRVGLRLTLEDGDIPILFKNGYIASIFHSSTDWTSKITVITSYNFEKSDKELVKQRERNHPSLKRFRILNEED